MALFADYNIEEIENETDITEETLDDCEESAIPFSKIPSLHEVESEIATSLKSLNNVSYEKRIQLVGIPGAAFYFDKYLIDINREYDLTRGNPIENLEKVVRSNTFQRCSCVAHKLNVA